MSSGESTPWLTFWFLERFYWDCLFTRYYWGCQPDTWDAIQNTVVFPKLQFKHQSGFTQEAEAWRSPLPSRVLVKGWCGSDHMQSDVNFIFMKKKIRLNCNKQLSRSTCLTCGENLCSKAHRVRTGASSSGVNLQNLSGSLTHSRLSRPNASHYWVKTAFFTCSSNCN